MGSMILSCLEKGRFMRGDEKSFAKKGKAGGKHAKIGPKKRGFAQNLVLFHRDD